MRNYYNSFGFRISESKNQVIKKAIPRSFGNLSSAKSLWMIIIMLLAFAVGNQKMLAQSTANYAFSSVANGSLTDMSTGTTQLLAAGVDDTASPLTNFNLGTGSVFDFYFMGNRYSQFGVTDNGIMTLGVAPGTGVYVLPNSTVPTLAPFANDMRIGSNGKVEAKVLGTAPNRTLVVQWTNVMLRYLSSAAAGTATFQVRLNESTGKIEYAYGAMATNTAAPAAYYVGFSSNTTSTNLVTIDATTNSASTVTPATTNAYLASSSVTALNSATDGSRVVYSFTPAGSAGNVVATLAPPTALTFSGVNAAGMTLNWAEATPTAGVLKYAVYRSSDAGATYTFQSLVNFGTNTLTVTGLVPSTNYTWKVYSISEGGKSTDVIASQATGLPGNITAIATGNWNDVTTWSGGAVPTATDNVIIPSAITVTEDVTAATAYTLTVAGNLVYTATTARTLTVGTNVTIDAGGTFKSAATGTVATHSLVIGGNLVNNGTIDFNAFSTSGATITFNTAGNANFTLGASSVTNLRNTNGVTLNKGNVSSVLTFTPGGTLTVQGANTLGFLTITSGMFKFDETVTFSHPLFAAAGYTIGTAGGFWLNNPNVTITAQAGSPTINGTFRLTNGTYNVGTTTGNSVGFGAGSTIIVEGGTINAASRFGVGTATNTINYTQSGGTLNLNSIGNASTTLATWDLGTSTSSVVSVTGGTINILNAGTGASGPRDIRGASVVLASAGGTINVGNASTATNFVFRVQGVIPAAIIVNNSTNPKTLQALGTTLINGNLTVNAGSTFDINGVTVQALGSVANDGIIAGNTTLSRFDFAGTTPQTYSGAGVFGTTAAPILSVGISNAANVTLSSPIIASRYNLFGGTFINSNQLTVGNGIGNGVVQRGGGTATAGSFDVAPNFNLLNNQLLLLYTTSTALITSGFEIPSSRIVTGLTVNNIPGVTLAGGNLDTAALTLTLGNINTSAANTLSLSGTLATSLTGGSTTSYINGPFARSVATGNANTNYILFPVGKAEYNPISLAPTTTAASVFKAESFATNSGTADPSIINLNAKRWEAPLVSGTITDLNVRLGDAGLVNTNIPVHALTANGAYRAAFGSLVTFATGIPNTIQSTVPILSADYAGFLGYATSNACSGTPTPGNTLASATSICFGQSVTLSLQNTTAGTGVTYSWESSTDGLTYAPIAGATSPSYVATPNVPTYYKANVICGGNTGTSVAVQIGFTNSITPGSVVNGIRCGEGTITLSASGNSGTVINWFTAETGGVQAGSGSPFTTPVLSANANYYAAAELQTVSDLTVGTATTLTGATEQPTAFCNRWANYTSQTIYTASELLALGLRAGNITSMAFNTTTLGDAATNANFTVKIGTTTANNFANTTFLNATAYATVYGPVTHTHTASGLQTINFSTPYVWDGASNIVINIYHAGANGTNNSQTYFTATTDDKVLFSTTGAAPTTGTLSKNRLNIIFNGNVACGSPRVLATATVTPAPAFALSATTTAFCSGSSSAPITIATGAESFTDYSWAPSTGVSGSAATGWVFNPTVNTNYVLTASQSSGAMCTATATVAVTVNSLPVISVLPATASVCAGSIQEVKVVDRTAVYGDGTTAPGTTAFPNPLSAYYGGVKHQILFTAAELLAQGLASGESISGLTFYANAFTASACTDFTIRIGNTTNTALTGFVSGTTTVYGPATFTPSATGLVTFAFTTPYIWNGTSNIVIETVHNAGNGGNGSGTLTRTTTTTNNSVYYGASDNIANGIAGFDALTTYGTSGASNLRPNVTLALGSIAPVWSPMTQLFTDAAATIPYNGEALAKVYAKPTANITYTATVTSAATCTNTATAAFTVNPFVTPNFAEIGTICSGSIAPVLATTSPNGVIGTWSPATVSNTANGTYVFTPNTGECATTQTLTVAVTTRTTPNFAEIGAVCSGSTAPTLATTSPNGVTGTWSPAIVSTTTGGTYVFTPTAGLCANTQSLVVTITSAPAQPTGNATQYGATLGNLVVSPSTGILWYANANDAASGDSPLPLTTPTVNNATYYVVQVSGTCRSTALAVTIDFNLGTPAFAVNQLKYYPNPVTDVLKVSYSDNISELKLYNLVGQQVLSKKVNANEAQIDMSSLPSGSYMLEVSSGSTSKIVKLIKK